MQQLLWEPLCPILTKLNTLLQYDTEIVILDTYPNCLKTYSHTKICTKMFIEALFIIAKTWRQPRFPLVDEWINCGILLSTKNMSFQAMKRHRGILNAYY